MASFRTTSVLVLGATVLAAFAVRFWPAREEDKPPAVLSPGVAVAPRGASGEREFSPPVPDPGAQRGIVGAEPVEAGVEPTSTAADAASAGSWGDADMPRSLPELYALDRADRTPRPFVPGCLTYPPTAFDCPRGGPLLTEEVDPDWSHATEERLRAIWNENVTGISSDFLFVMCKTTLCQINYRFPPETDDAGRNKPFDLFLRGFQLSGLASELQRTCITYSGTIVALEYDRKFPLGGPQPPPRVRTSCRDLSDLNQQRP